MQGRIGAGPDDQLVVYGRRIRSMYKEHSPHEDGDGDSSKSKRL